MAIATDSYYNIIYNEEVIDTIGLSKTLNNYTKAEIASMTYCGTQYLMAKNLSLREQGVGYLGWDLAKPMECTDGEHIGNGGKYLLGPGSSDYAYSNGLPLSVVWLAFGENITPPIWISTHEPEMLAATKIITEWDAPKYEYHITAPIQKGGKGATSWSDDSNDLYATPLYYHDGHDNQLKYRVNSNVDITVAPTGGPVCPYAFISVDSYFLLFQLNPQNNQWYTRGNATGAPWVPDSQFTGGGPWIDYDWTVSYGSSCNVSSLNKLSFEGEAIEWPYTWYYSENYAGNDWGAPLDCFGYNDLGEPIEVYFNGAPADGNGSQRGFTVTNFCKNRDQIYNVIAGGGIKFYTDKLYKPIIADGWVTGYTDDMTNESELDGWHGTTAHTVAPTPPTPGPTPGPYDDDPWHGVSFSGVGVGGAGAFAKCYYMTSTELANLRSWMNSNNVPEGFDPMAQIIGLSQVPVSLSGDDNTTVQFVNSSAVYDPGVTRLVDSGVSTQISMGIPKRYSLGSVNITRRMQERGEPYLDYDCQIELYLPLIGMFSLDTQAVMGRIITAEAVLDPISGTLAAYAYVTRDGQNLPIAYGSTTIGVDLPISAQQYSVARAALKQANAQLGTSLLSSTLSFIAAATAGGKGSGTGAKTSTGSTNGLAAAGIREAGADYMKASQAGNVFGDFMQWGRTIRQLSYGNNTAIAGSFGGSTAQWSYPFTPYVKIIRPRYEKPSNYKHSQGVPCVQTKTVGSCTGFIQCIGVDVSGITGATDIELQAIQAALTNGVFAGGGS